MKRIIAAALIGLASFTAAPAFADDQACTSLHQLATAIMTRRQEGVPMTSMMGIAASTDNQPVNELARMMVQAAYAEPQWQTEENRARAVVTFANDMAAVCYASQ